MRKDLLTSLYLFLLSVMMLLIVTCIIFMKRTPEKPPIHDYEYIMLVDGTDSINVYTIYDNEHKIIGTVKSNKLDSLIDNDNQ